MLVLKAICVLAGLARLAVSVPAPYASPRSLPPALVPCGRLVGNEWRLDDITVYRGSTALAPTIGGTVYEDADMLMGNHEMIKRIFAETPGLEVKEPEALQWPIMMLPGAFYLPCDSPDPDIWLQCGQGELYRWDVQGLMKAGGRPQPGETRCVMSIYGEARGERADVKTGWLFGSTWLDATFK